jgi:hypothetical protein
MNMIGICFACEKFYRFIPPPSGYAPFELRSLRVYRGVRIRSHIRDIGHCRVGCRDRRGYIDHCAIGRDAKWRARSIAFGFNDPEIVVSGTIV